jgi:lipopolysaccharide transport system ATP-binding protein
MRSQAPLIDVRSAGVCFTQRAGFLRVSRFWALQDVSFEVRPSETLGIVGRNGAGKSTLMKLLAGIVGPNRGVVINHGARVALLSLQVGFLPYLSGRQNAILSGLLLGLRKREIEAGMSEIKDFSGLKDFFDKPIHTYSSGMRVRLGFSVALKLDPDVLLVDEVLSVGDAEFQKKSLSAMREKMRSGKTVILVSHSSTILRQVCDRAVWIDDGVTRAEGDTESVLGAYEAAFHLTAARPHLDLGTVMTG